MLAPSVRRPLPAPRRPAGEVRYHPQGESTASGGQCINSSPSYRNAADGSKSEIGTSSTIVARYAPCGLISRAKLRVGGRDRPNRSISPRRRAIVHSPPDSTGRTRTIAVRMRSRSALAWRAGPAYTSSSMAATVRKSSGRAATLDTTIPTASSIAACRRAASGWSTGSGGRTMINPGIENRQAGWSDGPGRRRIMSDCRPATRRDTEFDQPSCRPIPTAARSRAMTASGSSFS